MSRIFEEENITYTKTLYNLVPYEKEITETVTNVVGRKCDRCNHIFKNPEQYFELIVAQDYESDSLVYDICIKCVENQFRDYLHEDGYDSLNVYKCINYL